MNSLILTILTMKFFKKFIKALGVSVAIFVNSNCKADGG